MGALSLPIKKRAGTALGAGCDIVLYCSGSLDRGREVVDSLPPMREDSQRRWARAQGILANFSEKEKVREGAFDEILAFERLRALVAPFSLR